MVTIFGTSARNLTLGLVGQTSCWALQDFTGLVGAVIHAFRRMSNDLMHGFRGLGASCGISKPHWSCLRVLVRSYVGLNELSY